MSVTSYNAGGGPISSVSFNVDVDNILPAPPAVAGPTGWQKGTELITASASTTGPSGISGQWCSVGGSTSMWYPGATAQIAVSASGEIPIDCTAQNGAGVTGPQTQYTAMVDNGAPTGAFLERDPNDPARVTAEVANALSPIAGGQIQIDTAQGWQNIATSFDPTVGQLTALVPDDGSLPDGNYQVRAIVTNAVGTSTAITAEDNGDPEVITEPARIVTKLDVAATATIDCKATKRKHRPDRLAARAPTARRARHCGHVALRTRAGIVTLAHGQGATVSGRLQTVDGNPLAGLAIAITERPTGARARALGTIATALDGSFNYTIPAGPSRTVTFAFAGTATLRPSQSDAAVSSRGAGTLRANHTTIAPGTMLVLSGRVKGGFIPTGGKIVQLWQQAGLGGWQPFEHAIYTRSNGRWRLAFRVQPSAGGATFRVKAKLVEQNGWPYLAASTRTITITVTRLRRAARATR